mmetsp:Transcript_22445/g.48831  ORF Transcript_22445/g.48831 Transcript_22445/m.48831 type:complete len:201 (-) Transcript_22445:2059-2661(-)
MIDLRNIMDLRNTQTLLVHCLCNRKDTTIGGNRQLMLQIFQGLEYIVRFESGNRWINHTHGLLDRFLHRSANTHNFSNGHHCRTDFTAHIFKLSHIPSRNLGDNVIQTRLERSLGLLSYGIDDLRHRNSETQLGGYKGKWVSSCFGSQSRRSGKTSVNFDNTIFKRFRMEGILNITLSNNTKMANSSDGSITKHVVFFIR